MPPVPPPSYAPDVCTDNNEQKKQEFSSLTVKLRANIVGKLHIAIDDCFLHFLKTFVVLFFMYFYKLGNKIYVKR